MTFIIISWLRTTSIIIQILIGSSKLHIEVVKGVLNAKLNFFEENPIGKILTRFSKD